MADRRKTKADTEERALHEKGTRVVRCLKEMILKDGDAEEWRKRAWSFGEAMKDLMVPRDGRYGGGHRELPEDPLPRVIGAPTAHAGTGVAKRWGPYKRGEQGQRRCLGEGSYKTPWSGTIGRRDSARATSTGGDQPRATSIPGKAEDKKT